MKKFLIVSLLVGFSSVLFGQKIGDWSKWFDGRVLYVAHVLENDEIFFDAPENKDGNYAFCLRKMDYGQGEYQLVPYNYVDDAPFRAQFGWRVQYIREEGMYFLAVRNGFDEIVWTLVFTPDNLSNSLANGLQAEERPIAEMIDCYLMSPAFLSKVPKDTLEILVLELQSRPNHSIIERTNLSLIKSELKTVESERAKLRR